MGTFVDDDSDWQHIETLGGICTSVNAIALNRSMAKLRAIRGFFRDQPLTTPFYQDRAMQAWVQDIALSTNIDCVIAYSSSMAQYAIPLKESGLRVIIDFCDMDSNKWRQYAEKMTGLQRYIYCREANQLQQEERRIAEQSDAAIFVSDEEASMFCSRTGVRSNKVHTIGNGVDLCYFDPDLEFLNPFQQGCEPVVFTGAMDYWPNVDAVNWFAREIFPGILSKNPDAVFCIVGSSPTKKVRELETLSGVKVVGRVEDIRPYLMFAKCIVAPLRIASGIQNKVLEAMAMARPVLASAAAVDGIVSGPRDIVKVCKKPYEWVAQVSSVLGSQTPEKDRDARLQVSRHYSWDASASKLEKLLVETR